jgi:hypothetical protein
VILDMMSAPTSSTVRARPASISEVPSARPDRKPVQAAPTSIAPARTAPSASATSGAALGSSSSAVVVATRTRSTSSGDRPASSSAAPPAAAARSARRSPGAAMCRARMPVRFTIHSSLTPIRSAMGAFVTTFAGTLVPIEAIAAPVSAGIGASRSGAAIVRSDTCYLHAGETRAVVGGSNMASG